MSRYVLSFEDIDTGVEESELLNLDRLEKEADQTGDYDALRDKNKELIEENKEAQADTSGDDAGIDTESEDSDGGSSGDDASPFDDPTGGEPDPDAPADDNAADAPPKDDKSKAGDDSSDDKSKGDKSKDTTKDAAADDSSKDEKSDLKESNGKVQTVATESLREDIDYRWALESFDTMNLNIGANLGSLASTAWDMTVSGARLLKDLAVTLVGLGIRYSPTLARVLKVSVVYLFTKGASGLLKMISVLLDSMKRFHYAFGRRKNDIAKLHAQIVDLKKKQFSSREATIQLTSEGSTDQKLISWMTCGNKTSADNTLNVVSKFMAATIAEIDKKLSYDLNSVKKLIELSENNYSGNPVDVMQVSPFNGFMKRRIKGHEENPAYVTPYVYNEPLADGVIFAANLPNHDLTELADITAAYKASGMFLTSDSVYAELGNKADYVDLPTLEKFLDRLEALCDLGLEHVSFYQRVGKQCEALKFNYRHFYQRLIADAKGKNIRDTLVEYVCLKQTFVKKVYLPAAVDIHEYVGAYLVRAIRYAKGNLAALKVVEKDSSV